MSEDDFFNVMHVLFGAVRDFLDYDLNFPFGQMDLLDIACSLTIMYMLADIAESYFGFNGRDGDNR